MPTNSSERNARSGRRVRFGLGFRRFIALAAAFTIVAPLLVGGASVPAKAETLCLFEPCFEADEHSLDEASSLWVVVNKQRPLDPINYVPKNLVQPAFANPARNNPYRLRVAKPAADALVKMTSAMRKAGFGDLFIQSAYRSFDYQRSVHAGAVSRLGLRAGEALAARPGHSEHQTGLAIDVGAVGQGCLIYTCFGKTKAGRYLAKYAYKYGFIIRYPEGKTPITGYQYEPWHLRYVGPGLATEMRNNVETVLESFWGLEPAPNY